MDVEPELEAVPRDEAADLQVKVIPGRRHVLCGVKNVVRTVIRIQTPENSAEHERPPISVACVLDRSGSMSGLPLDFAKRACKKMVKHLDETDTLHFITYDTNVQTIFENGDLTQAGKEALKTKIDALKAGSTTNLYGGLERAAALMGGQIDFSEKLQNRDDTDRKVRRIFLFSDGCVNAGITDPGEIMRRVASWAEQGITTTAFGIGANFDEPLMRGIAESGKGRYIFLATAQDIPRLVSKSIHGLLKLYGSEASVDIRGASHTIVTKIHGGDDDENQSDACTSGLLQLGDLHSANERMILVELESAPPGDTADGQSFKAAEWFLDFQRNGAPVQFSGDVNLVAVKQRASLGREAVPVQAMFAIRRGTELELEVAELLKQGNRVDANNTKSQQISLLKETLEVARSDAEADPVDIQALEAVLRRAESVAERLRSTEDSELVRRRCVQEVDLNRALSVDGFSDGNDSSPASEEGHVHLQQRLRDFDDDSADGSSTSACGIDDTISAEEPESGSVSSNAKSSQKRRCSLM